MPDSFMKAVVHDRYGGPDVLQLADIPVPEPGKGQVRVKVLACAVNLSDWEYLVGSPFYARQTSPIALPMCDLNLLPLKVWILTFPVSIAPSMEISALSWPFLAATDTIRGKYLWYLKLNQ